MKTFYIYLLLPLLAIFPRGCQLSSYAPIVCSWNHSVCVHLDDLYLDMPCKDDLFSSSDYEILKSCLNIGGGTTNLYKMMDAANQGFWDSSSCLWTVTAAEVYCTDSTKNSEWNCDNNNMHFLRDDNSLIEVPKSLDANPWMCKRHFEAIVVLHTGETIVWERDWDRVDFPNFISSDYYTETFFVSSYERPLTPKIYNKAQRRIYIHNQFQTI